MLTDKVSVDMRRDMHRLIPFIFLVISSFLVVSCSGRKDDKGMSADPLRLLSEEEKQRLVTPTIYYIPQYTTADHANCTSQDRVDILDTKNYVIVSSCRRIYRNCQMQGTCKVQLENGQSILINVDRVNEHGIRTFKRVTSKECIYGAGNSRDRFSSYRQMCIDPFYSVAADLTLYNLGDVIYMPMLKGVILPDGSMHNGYVIVRDSGQRIKGYGRFDFFTGYLGITRINPFFKIGLGGGSHYPEYYLIRGSDAQRIRAERGFPYLTSHLNPIIAGN